jgi:hypothetical protein
MWKWPSFEAGHSPSFSRYLASPSDAHHSDPRPIVSGTNNPIIRFALRLIKFSLDIASQADPCRPGADQPLVDHLRRASLNAAAAAAIRAAGRQSTPPGAGVGPRAHDRIAACYCACARTHTATSGLSALLGVSPHEAEFSLRKFAE